MQRIVNLPLVFLILIGVMGCVEKDKTEVISLEKREEIKMEQELPGDKHLHIAVGGMITPSAGFDYYRRFLDYIEENTGMEVDFVDKEDYAEINKLVKSGKVDVAFVCGGPYVNGHKEFGMELLVAPRAYGKSVYYSYIIVSEDSPVKDFEELRGKRFAFSDPLSNTGKLVPTYMLAKMNETPDSFFKKYIFTHSHDKSIKAVARGIVEGAAVDSLIWEYANRASPELTSKTRIIKKSPPYGIPPVVVRPGLGLKTKERLKEIFLDADKDAKGKEILKGMMIDKFVLIDDSAYDSIREMKSWIAEHKGEN